MIRIHVEIVWLPEVHAISCIDRVQIYFVFRGICMRHNHFKVSSMVRNKPSILYCVLHSAFGHVGRVAITGGWHFFVEQEFEGSFGPG